MRSHHLAAGSAPSVPSSLGMLAALRHRNFRLYAAAQIFSSIGTWVQIIVENWLVLEMSGSGLALGVTNALQFGPALLFGLYGGVLADRHDRRRLLMLTQGCLALLSCAVGALASVGSLRVWMIWLAALCLGLVKCFDMPALQSLVKDLVGPRDLPNAVAWTNAISAMGRMAGPALGGLALTTLGAAPGFLINAATFGAVVLMLATLRQHEMAPRTPVPQAAGQIKAGLDYVRSDPELAMTAIIMIVVFAAAYNFQISLALIASDILNGDSRVYGSLLSALGLGATMGSLIVARRARLGVPTILVWTCSLAATQAALAETHHLVPLLIATFAYGVSAGLFNVTVIATLQARAVEDMRGRVMALYSVCFLGVCLVSGPAFGGLAAWIGVSGALRAAACLCAGVAVTIAIARFALARPRGRA